MSPVNNQPKVEKSETNSDWTYYSLENRVRCDVCGGAILYEKDWKMATAIDAHVCPLDDDGELTEV